MNKEASIPEIAAINKLLDRHKHILSNDTNAALLLRDDTVSLVKRVLHDGDLITRGLLQLKFTPQFAPSSSEDRSTAFANGMKQLERHLLNFRYSAEHQALIPLPKPEEVTLSWLWTNLPIRYLVSGITTLLVTFNLGVLSADTAFGIWLRRIIGVILN